MRRIKRLARASPHFTHKTRRSGTVDIDLAMLYSLSANSGIDAATALKAGEIGLKRATPGEVDWPRRILGLANYRAGKYDRTLALLNEEEASSRSVTVGDLEAYHAYGRVIRAMVLAKLGRVEDARRLLGEANAIRDHVGLRILIQSAPDARFDYWGWLVPPHPDPRGVRHDRERAHPGRPLDRPDRGVGRGRLRADGRASGEVRSGGDDPQDGCRPVRRPRPRLRPDRRRRQGPRRSRRPCGSIPTISWPASTAADGPSNRDDPRTRPTTSRRRSPGCPTTATSRPSASRWTACWPAPTARSVAPSSFGRTTSSSGSRKATCGGMAPALGRRGEGVGRRTVDPHPVLFRMAGIWLRPRPLGGRGGLPQALRTGWLNASLFPRAAPTSTPVMSTCGTARAWPTSIPIPASIGTWRTIGWSNPPRSTVSTSSATTSPRRTPIAGAAMITPLPMRPCRSRTLRCGSATGWTPISSPCPTTTSARPRRPAAGANAPETWLAARRKLTAAYDFPPAGHYFLDDLEGLVYHRETRALFASKALAPTPKSAVPEPQEPVTPSDSTLRRCGVLLARRASKTQAKRLMARADR